MLNNNTKNRAARILAPFLLIIALLCGCTANWSVDEVSAADVPLKDTSLTSEAVLTRGYFYNAKPTPVSGTVVGQRYLRIKASNKQGEAYEHITLVTDIRLDSGSVAVKTDDGGIIHIVQSAKSIEYLERIPLQPLKLVPGSEVLVALNDSMEKYVSGWSESEKSAKAVIGAPEVVYNSVFSAVKQPSGEYSVHRQMNRIMDEDKETYSCDELVSAIKDWSSTLDPDFVPRMD